MPRRFQFSLRALLVKWRSNQNPAEMNRQWCRTIQERAEQKLGRQLTNDESDRIWNTGSFMQLELIARDVDHAKTAEEIEKILIDLPVCIPLPDEYTQRD